MRKIYTLKKVLLLSALGLAFLNTSQAQLLNESFDDITLLTGNNWSLQNLSAPAGTEDWTQGYTATANQAYYFVANSGHDSSFISGNFQNTSGTGTISNWLITPPLFMSNNDTLSFFTRSTDLMGTVYPDNLQVWLNQTNTTDVGTSELSTGDFTDLLLEINPALDQTSYPFVWTRYDIAIAGLPVTGVTGRIGFRYFVTDGGPSGANSFIIGIDDVIYSDGTTGISNASQNDFAISLSPNPTTNFINVNLKQPIVSTLSVKITNVLGQLIYETKLNAGDISSKLDVSTFAAGTYSITFSGVNTYLRKSFVKN